MGSNTKNLLIGVFIVSACSFLVAIVMFLKPTIGDEKKILFIRFSNVNKINVGTRVTYAGRPVGQVVAIDPIYEPRNQPTDTLGRFYFYQLTLKVDSSVLVYNTDEITLQTSGLLGEKSVAITPRRPPQGITPKEITHQPIYANSTDPIENAFVQLSDVAGKMEDTLNEVNKWIKENGDSLAIAINHCGSALKEIHFAVAKVNEMHLLEEISQTAAEIRLSTATVQKMLTDTESQGIFANLKEMTQHLKTSTASFELFSHDLTDGKGTLSKLCKFDDLYQHMNTLLNNVNTLLTDINDFGLLFHTSKRWQSLHRARVAVAEED